MGLCADGLTECPSIISTRYAKVGITKMKNSSNTCKSLVGIDPGQLYPFSYLKDMPTGVYTEWLLWEDTGLFHHRRNKKIFLEYLLLNYFQMQDPQYSSQSQFNRKSLK